MCFLFQNDVQTFSFIYIYRSKFSLVVSGAQSWRRLCSSNSRSLIRQRSDLTQRFISPAPGILICWLTSDLWPWHRETPPLIDQWCPMIATFKKKPRIHAANTTFNKSPKSEDRTENPGKESHKIYPQSEKYHRLCSPTCWNWLKCSPHWQPDSHRTPSRENIIFTVMNANITHTKQISEAGEWKEKETESEREDQDRNSKRSINPHWRTGSTAGCQNAELPECERTYTPLGSERGVAFTATFKKIKFKKSRTWNGRFVTVRCCA